MIPTPRPITPAISPMLSVMGVPTMITLSRSRPTVSVPSGCSSDGARSGMSLPTLAPLTSTTSGPSSPSSTTAEMMTSPMTSWRYVRSRPSQAFTPDRSVGNPRIEQWQQQVEHQGGQANRHDQHEGHAIDDKVIETANGQIQQIAHARVGKHNFDQD